MISYSTKILSENLEDIKNLKSLLEQQKLVFNFASKQQFGSEVNSIVILHSKVYYNIRKQYPKINSQVVIKAEQECLAKYKSIKSNKEITI